MSRPRGARTAMLNVLLGMAQLTDINALEAYWLPDPEWKLYVEVPGYTSNVAVIDAALAVVVAAVPLGEGVSASDIVCIEPGTYTRARKDEESFRL